uniref:Uncharacterized protein n=1 Tax=Siphoviridae sp. ctcMb1 TaxID=2827276 RepID=A0A8S5R5H0_9CAUD|nr:MAG TPA: hypothetical protein [Siphoviridae sp. ctcMb1]
MVHEPLASTASVSNQAQGTTVRCEARRQHNDGS